MSITIYNARKVVTLDPARPIAQAVAVRGERIVAAGSLEELAQFDDAVVDDRYAGKVIFPGLIEAHAHLGTASNWKHVYVGYFDRTDVDGKIWPGCTTFDAVLDRLRKAEALLTDSSATLNAWGLDPIYFPGDRMVAEHLDRVSTSRPIAIKHANGHLMTVNSALMAKDGIDASVMVEGVAKDDAGEPIGELQEFAAMSLAASSDDTMTGAGVVAAELFAYGRAATNTGTTTIVDLASSGMLRDGSLETFTEVAADPDFSVRLAPFHIAAFSTPGLSTDEAIAGLDRYRDAGLPKLPAGYVKLMLDGSIQSFTARMQEPGYLNKPGHNGIWIMSPEDFEAKFEAFHLAGYVIHTHCNADEATELYLEKVERILSRHPKPCHRHTITHSQLSTPAQYRRMAALGVAANIFSNHLWYWGDQHMDVTVGVDRAQRMNAAGTALREGVKISLHSDSPVTQLAPLATASYAAERKTATGRSIGENERIGVEDALRAVTLGSAWMLGLDHLVGSIEGGKYADFAILDRDPLEVAEPAELRDITVHGTVVGGDHYAAAGV